MMNKYQKKILLISWPIILGEISLTVQSIINDIMVAPLGEASLAAVGVSNALILNVFLVGFGILSIITNLIGIYSNEDDSNYEKAQNVVNAGLNAAVILGIIVTLILLFFSHYFHFLGQDQSVNVIAKEYLFIVSFSAIFYFIFIAITNVFDGMTITTVPFYMTVVSIVVNFIGNILLVYGYLGFPQLGVKGAAYSLLFSQFLLCFMGVIYLFKTPDLIDVRPKKISLAKFFELKEIFTLGTPVGLQYLFEYGALFVANVFVGWIGVTASAAHQIAMGLVDLTNQFMNGLGVGSSILISEQLGKKNIIEIKLLSRHTLKLALVIQASCSLVYLIFHDSIPKLYGLDVETVKIASMIIIIAAFEQVFDALQTVLLCMLCGIKDTFVPSIYSLVSYWLMALPLGYFLAFPCGLGISGIWYGILLGVIVSALLLHLRYQKLLNSNQIFELADA